MPKTPVYRFGLYGRYQILWTHENNFRKCYLELVHKPKYQIWCESDVPCAILIEGILVLTIRLTFNQHKILRGKHDCVRTQKEIEMKMVYIGPQDVVHTIFVKSDYWYFFIGAPCKGYWGLGHKERRLLTKFDT